MLSKSWMTRASVRTRERLHTFVSRMTKMQAVAVATDPLIGEVVVEATREAHAVAQEVTHAVALVPPLMNVAELKPLLDFSPFILIWKTKVSRRVSTELLEANIRFRDFFIFLLLSYYFELTITL